MTKGVSIAEWHKMTGAEPVRRHKYGAKASVVDGIQFPSSREAKRYSELKARQIKGEISELKLQVSYPIVINEIHICTYIADFTCIENGELKVFDAKGFPTPDYILKRKMMKAVHGIEIVEI